MNVQSKPVEEIEEIEDNMDNDIDSDNDTNDNLTSKKVKKKRKNKKKKKRPTLEQTPYTCPKCGYNTILKGHIRDHFNKRKTLCPAITNNIELTEEIKEYVLLNRVYNIPKPEKVIVQKEKKIEYIELTISISINYVSLVWPKEYVRTNEPIYKTGNTVTTKNHVNLSRLTSYGVGSKVLLLLECNDALDMERLIKKRFNEEFSRHEFGTEFFVGDKKIMMKIMMECVMSEES
jgi:transcription elongation factor Elf1